MEKTKLLIDVAGQGALRKDWLLSKIGKDKEFNEMFNKHFEVVGVEPTLKMMKTPVGELL